MMNDNGKPVSPVDLAIVVVTFNRPGSLKRLLHSLAAAHYPQSVQLIISIDGGAEPDTLQIARDFLWEHGEKLVIPHESNLGLRRHILACGDLTSEHDGIILLEDDLYVAPYFFDFALSAYEFYHQDDKLGGISLYSHSYNETAQFPFVPMDDGSDVFFLQYASSWGQLWTRNQWRNFREWYEIHSGDKLGKGSLLPPNIHIWPDSSWKKYYIKYLVDTDRYFVFPRFSLTTNFCDAGHHMKFKEHFLQEPLAVHPREFRFIPLKDSSAVYDCHLEILPRILKQINPRLREYDFAVDLYRMKDLDEVKEDLVLTAWRNPGALLSFGKEMKPHESNIIFDLPGKEITLGRKDFYPRRNFFIKMLESHRRHELAYFYQLRRYHFYRKKLLYNQKRKGFGPGFLFRKTVSMFKFILERMFK
jgi:glycosyltransferase involved in cell wall biosynthesis